MTDPFPEPLAQRLQRALGPQYRLEDELGRGGMGVVFRATDTTLDRSVAVKVVHPELAAHETIAWRFLAEARMIARLRHPNIVAVHTAGNADGLLYYVMDDVPGESLRQRLLRERRLAPDDVARIVSDLAAALHAAGAAGFVHRDVKPENVLLDNSTDRALLTDFGIARAMLGGANAPTTGRGVAIGTPAYMSPEQAAGEETDSRSDIYALGVVAYEMLAGRPPFDGPGRVVVSKHLTERPVPIERLRPECPAPLAAAVMRALEKQPSRRWQTGEEFRQALRGEQPVPRRVMRRRILAAGVAALLAIVGTVAVARRQDGPPTGTDPRHSILVLPFDNLREDQSVEWLRDASVSMLALNMSQWNDLTVVDHERLHDLLARRDLQVDNDLGLDMARRLARDAGVWTVVLGDYAKVGDSLYIVARVYDVSTGARVDVARVDGAPGEDVRPLFDELAARLLDLSGAPEDIRTNLAQATTYSLEAFRAYLDGVEALNRWNLADAEQALERATQLDTTFGLAYYKLALTRGWLVGAQDSVSDRAMVRALAHSDRLPDHERTVIRAYRAFLEAEYAAARDLYGQLLARDPSDADAWYGLGEAWFHDVHEEQSAKATAAAWTQSLRAFRRALALDPDYALAYDHLNTMLTVASTENAPVALLPGDSLVETLPAGGRQLDSTTRVAAEARAREAAVSFARNWAASQPDAVRAHGALVDAYIAAGNYDAALAEVSRFRAMQPDHPEQPFLEARIHFAAGEVDRAAAILRPALDSAAPGDFERYESTPAVLDYLASAANVFAYQGDADNAARAIDFTDRVQDAVYPEFGGDQPHEHWRRQSLAQLYAAMGGPTGALRNIWEGTVEESRMAPPEQREEILKSGATAALGLLIGPEGDSSAVAELEALTGDDPTPEVEALLALSRADTATARQMLARGDSAAAKALYPPDYRPLAAQVYYQLGQYEKALELLEGFEPDALSHHGFDWRWGMLGRVRLLRAAAHERLGNLEAARKEYRMALAQWNSADSTLAPYIRQARQGLARMEGTG